MLNSITAVDSSLTTVTASLNVPRNDFYYILIYDTTLELSVFWPSDTESRIKELRFSDSISLSLKTRLTPVACFCGVASRVIRWYDLIHST